MLHFSICAHVATANVDSAQRVVAGLVSAVPFLHLNPLIVLQQIVKPVAPFLWAQSDVALGNDVVASVAVQALQ